MYKTKINLDIKQAMKNKEADKLSVLRMLMSALNNEAIAKKKKEEGLSEDEELQVLKREVKKRKDSVEQYENGGRSELAEKEKQELEIIQAYLPEEMSEEEVKKIIEEVVSGIGEVAPSQFGQIMSQAMAKVKGKADGNLVSKIVKELIQ
ncbi:MAG: GatB/YqeY domain-containing protein [Patescibacteria group bacterium]